MSDIAFAVIMCVVVVGALVIWRAAMDSED